jgi:excisionase family DNA binding protein
MTSALVWLTAAQAAERAQVSTKTICAEAKAGRLRVARVGGRREIRVLAEWVDAWLIASSTPQEQSR